MSSTQNLHLPVSHRLNEALISLVRSVNKGSSFERNIETLLSTKKFHSFRFFITMGWLDFLDKYLLAGNRHWFKRVLYLVLFLFSAYIIYDSTGAKYATRNARLDAIQKISALLKDSSIDGKSKQQFRHELNDLVGDQDLRSAISKSISSLFNAQSVATVNRSSIFKTILGWFIHILSSTWLYLLIVFTAKRNTPKDAPDYETTVRYTRLYYLAMILTAPILFYFLPPYDSNA